MKINVFPFEKAEAQKADLRGKLGLSPSVKLDFAFDAVHGLNDLCRSLADLHPHKRSIASLGPQPSPIREILAGFAGQGFSVQELPVSIDGFDEPKMRAAWDALKKDTLFVLTSALEPFTGAVYPFEWIRGEGPKRNIFTVLYMSPDALKRGVIVPSTPFESVILDPLWNDEYSLAAVLKGERCQGDKFFWGESHFSDRALARFEERLAEFRADQVSEAALASPGVLGVSPSRVENPHENSQAVKKFEAQLVARCPGIQTIGSGTRRHYDRAVIFVPGAHGEAVCHALKKDGFEAFTAAACAWNSPHLNPWLSKLGLSAELVESSVIVPLETVLKSKAEETLAKRIKEFQKISGLKI